MICPKWCKFAIWIGGALSLLAIVIFLIRDSQVSSYNSAQQSWGGLGEMFRDFSGQSEQERSSISAVHGFGVFIWWVGLLLWGSGVGRWAFWAIAQRPRFKVLGYGPVAVPGAGFVFQPPLSWTVESVEGCSIPICFGKPISGFRPNINFQLDDLPGTIEDSLARGKAASVGQISNWTDISYEKFSTNQRNGGARLIAQGSSGAGHLRYNIYVFQRSDGVKLLIYCTSPASQGGLLDSVFDQSVRNMLVE